MTSTPSTNTPSPPTEAGTTRSTSKVGRGGNSGISRNRRNRNNNKNQPNKTINQVQLSKSVTYEGHILEVGCFLSLRYEKFNNKSSLYEVFLEKVANYVVSNLKNGGDTRPLFTKMIDPTAIFNDKRRPNFLSTKYYLVSLEVKIHEKRIEIFVVRRDLLIANMERCLSIVWRKCSSVLQSRIKDLEEYGEVR